jgi:hypothetical protein
MINAYFKATGYEPPSDPEATDDAGEPESAN